MMNAMLKALLSISCVLVVACSVSRNAPLSGDAVPERVVEGPARTAVRRSFTEVRSLASNALLGPLGMSSVEEMDRATTSVELAVFSISAGALRTYSADLDPATLLNDSGTKVALVSVDGVVRSLAYLRRSDDGKWQVARSGYSNYAKLIVAGLQRIRGAGTLDDVAPILIEDRALGAAFVGWFSHGRLMLVDLLAESEPPRDAAQALRRFAEGAR